MTENTPCTELIGRIKEIAREVNRELGPGYSERVYHNAMEVGLREEGLKYETERIVPIRYKGHVIGNTRADLIVEGEIVVELKAVNVINQVMRIQLESYLRMTGLLHGLLINFSQQGDFVEYVKHT